MEKEYKVIDAHIYDPVGIKFLKGVAKDKAKCTIVQCNNSENCGMFARGECSYLAILNWQRCPYGKVNEEEGFTKQARNYSDWINEKKERYKEVINKIKSHSDVMSIVGEHIFLPYSHITMNETVPFLAHGGAFRKENCFLLKEHFTIKNIISICEFRPYAMMGGEITSYQNEVVPKFIKHLSELLPETYKLLCVVYERAKLIVDSYSHIGRKALLKTITPNIGKLIDCHKGEWIWDGEYLTSFNSHASFMLTNKFSELRLKPLDNVEVVITDNGQVNKDTKFLS